MAYIIHGTSPPIRVQCEIKRFCKGRAVAQEKLTHVPWRKTSVCENGSSTRQEECYMVYYYVLLHH